MARTKPILTGEFFAGIGLVRFALEQEGFKVVFANDIERKKRDLYAANFDAEHFLLDDVRLVRGSGLPRMDLATASFPCTDLSLAGNRAGLDGGQSGMFWEFARVLEEMGARRPSVVMLENVLGFATSHGGADMEAAICRLNRLGYVCDVFVVDAIKFVPQSRPRMFIVGSRKTPAPAIGEWRDSPLRPPWIADFVEANPGLKMRPLPLADLPRTNATLADAVERMEEDDFRWWLPFRQRAFVSSLSPLQAERLRKLKAHRGLTWATAYRRTRNGRATWEIRADAVSGCLRTARGGSSKQAVVEAGNGRVRIRWMTAREYARLQGAPDFKLHGVSQNAAMFGFGDAVCVPVVSWIARTYLRPLIEGKPTGRADSRRSKPCRELVSPQMLPLFAKP